MRGKIIVVLLTAGLTFGSLAALASNCMHRAKHGQCEQKNESAEANAGCFINHHCSDEHTAND